MPSPTVIDSTSAVYGSVANVSTPAPTLANGCLVLFAVFGRGNNPLNTPPSGANGELFEGVATASGQSSGTGSGARVHVLQHRVDIAANEPGTYAAIMSAGLNGGVAAISLADVDENTPIEIALVTSDVTGTDAVVICPSVDTTSTNTLVIRIPCMNTSVGIDSWASGDCTEVEDLPAAATRVSGAIGWENQAAAGSTGTASWTATMTGGATTYGSALGITIALPPPLVLASAGAPQTVEPGDTVTIDCSASSGVITSRNLVQTGGPITVNLKDATSATPTFHAPKPPTSSPMVLTFQETVIGADNTSIETTTVTVNPAPVPGLQVYELDALGDPIIP